MRNTIVPAMISFALAITAIILSMANAEQDKAIINLNKQNLILNERANVHHERLKELERRYD